MARMSRLKESFDWPKSPMLWLIHAERTVCDEQLLDYDAMDYDAAYEELKDMQKNANLVFSVV